MLIWKWDGSLSQILGIKYPIGYLVAPRLIEFADFEGRTCIKMVAAFRDSSGGEASPTIAIHVKGVTEYWSKAVVFIPTENGYMKSGGSLGWMASHLGLEYTKKVSDMPQAAIAALNPTGTYAAWGSGNLSLGESTTSRGLVASSELRYHPLDPGVWVNIPNFKFPKGKWVTWISYTKLHETQGIRRNWIDKVLVSEFTDVCTDPTRLIGASTPKVEYRHYANDDRVPVPSNIYYSDLAIQTEPFEPEPSPPIELPVIVPATRTLVAQALPFPLILAKLWRLRTRFIREDIHRKVHPLI